MKKSIKRIIAICVAVILVGTVFAACSSDGSKKTYTIGICQQQEHPALDLATQGFVDAVKAVIGEENVTIDPQTAQGDSSTCSTIVNQFVSSGKDLIMCNGTTALQSASTATPTIPIVGTSITEYGVALGLTDFSGKTGINVTGTSDLAPLDQQADMITKICPEVKTVGILYCSAEPNSKYQATEVAKFLSDAGVTAKEYTFSDSNDIQAVVTKAVSENDALYVPTDNTAAANTGIIDSVARNAKVPVFAGEEGICSGCGVATLSISYYDIGYAAGEMAADILVNGKNPAEMEIGYAPKFTKEFNEEICSDLGITVPDDYVAIAAE